MKTPTPAGTNHFKPLPAHWRQSTPGTIARAVVAPTASRKAPPALILRPTITMNWLRVHAVLSTAALTVLATAGFRQRPPTVQDEITVRRINVVDSLGKTRVILAGGFPPRRANLAGLLFMNEDGGEAGGFGYSGHRAVDGEIQAGAVLTFDQYRNDQILALEYRHRGDRKQQGLTIQDRPDTLSDLLKRAYREVETAPTATARDSLQRYWQSRLPASEVAARRLFVGRDFSRAAVLTLADPQGRVRLRMQVDSLGHPSISFLDEKGTVTRIIAQ